MGTCGWLGTNEILDFSFHRLTKVVEKDLGEYAGKSTSEDVGSEAWVAWREDSSRKAKPTGSKQTL